MKKFKLNKKAIKKLEFIRGSYIATNFPNSKPTKQWAGAVLDFLEETGLLDVNLNKNKQN